MKNLNAIIILATVAGMATLTACSSTKDEQAPADTKEAAVPAETTADTPAPGPGMGGFGGPGMMGPGMGGFGGGMGGMGGFGGF